MTVATPRTVEVNEPGVMAFQDAALELSTIKSHYLWVIIIDTWKEEQVWMFLIFKYIYNHTKVIVIVVPGLVLVFLSSLHPLFPHQ